MVATLDDPGTGRGRVEHARAARWLASQRLRSSMRYGNVSCHHNRNPFLEVNFVLEAPLRARGVGSSMVITGRERRRRWTAEQKREIAAESLQPGISPVMVARRYGISSGLLYTWRQQLLCGALGVMAGTKPRFVRVDVVAGPPQPEASMPADPELVPTPQTSPTAELDGRIEIMLSSGAKVRVDAQVNEAALRRVLAALARS